MHTCLILLLFALSLHRYGCELRAASRMPECVGEILLPISAHCLFTHQIDITSIVLELHLFTKRCTIYEPLIMDGDTGSQVNGYDLLSFTITMKANAALIDIVVVVPLTLKLLRFLSEVDRE